MWYSIKVPFGPTRQIMGKCGRLNLGTHGGIPKGSFSFLGSLLTKALQTRRYLEGFEKKCSMWPRWVRDLLCMMIFMCFDSLYFAGGKGDGSESMTRLRTLVPSVGVFHTKLKLLEAFEEYDAKYRVTSRK